MPTSKQLTSAVKCSNRADSELKPDAFMTV